MSESEHMPAARDCGGDAAAYALGALDPVEVEGFQRHLERCASCRDEVAGLQEVANVLPFAAPPQRPPKVLRRRVLKATREDATPVARRWHGSRASTWRRRSTVLAGLCAALALAVFGGLEAQGGTQVRVIQARLAGISGRASVRLSDGHSELIVRHLSPPPLGDIYELWLKRPHHAPAPTSVLFSVTSAGAGEIGLPPTLHGVSEIMVTPEPDGGSPFPTHSPVIVAHLT